MLTEVFLDAFFKNPLELFRLLTQKSIGKGNVLRKGKLIIKSIINKNQDELNNFRNSKMILNSTC